MAVALTVKEDASDYTRISPDKIENPHDKFFKETFSHIEVAESFLHHYLPLDVMEVLNTETLALQKDSFIDKKLKQNFSDLLFSAEINGREGYVYFLFEHKSYPDKTVVFQLLKYMAEIWRTKMKKEKMDQLPLIIPLLIYHGSGAWNLGKTLSGTIAGYSDIPPGIRKFTPDYEYLVYDISQYTDEEIKGESRVRILLTLFRDVQKAENIEELLRVIGTVLTYLQELDDKQAAKEYFETFMLYIIHTAKNIVRSDVRKIVKRVGTIYPEGSGVIMTIADVWREEGEERGIVQGVRKVALEMLRKGSDIHFVSEVTHIDVGEIRKMKEQLDK